MKTKKFISILKQSHAACESGNEISVNGNIYISKSVKGHKISEPLSSLVNRIDNEDFENTIEEEFALIQLGKSDLEDYAIEWVNYQFNRRYELKDK